VRVLFFLGEMISCFSTLILNYEIILITVPPSYSK